MPDSLAGIVLAAGAARGSRRSPEYGRRRCARSATCPWSTGRSCCSPAFSAPCRPTRSRSTSTMVERRWRTTSRDGFTSRPRRPCSARRERSAACAPGSSGRARGGAERRPRLGCRPRRGGRHLGPAAGSPCRRGFGVRLGSGAEAVRRAHAVVGASRPRRRAEWSLPHRLGAGGVAWGARGARRGRRAVVRLRHPCAPTSRRTSGRAPGRPSWAPERGSRGAPSAACCGPTPRCAPTNGCVSAIRASDRVTVLVR